MRLLRQVVGAGRNHIRFPGLVRRADVVVRYDDADAMINGDAEQANRPGAANHAAEVFQGETVEVPLPKFGLDLSKLRPVEAFAFSHGGDDQLLGRAVVKISDHFPTVVGLDFEALLLF